MNSLEYLRIFSDDEGCSHFETKGINLKAKDYAPPTTPFDTSALESADNSIFLVLPYRLVRKLASYACTAMGNPNDWGV
ncbi:MAG: hypothetical protein O7D86_01250 [Proteobacteria bacterium]|nr:hypothetical protein [Pseudomonadota bacterium]